MDSLVKNKLTQWYIVFSLILNSLKLLLSSLVILCKHQSSWASSPSSQNSLVILQHWKRRELNYPLRLKNKKSGYIIHFVDHTNHFLQHRLFDVYLSTLKSSSYTIHRDAYTQNLILFCHIIFNILYLK